MTLIAEPPPTVVPAPAPPRLGARGELRAMFRGPAWPLAALLVLYPVWWGLGLTSFIWSILAIPMIRTLIRRRPIRIPPWFSVWVAFLGVVVLGIFTLNLHAPDTLADDTGSPIFVWGLRLIHYLTVTVILLFVGNLNEFELPRIRLVRMMGILFVITTFGGLLGMAAPHLEFSSPTQLILSSRPVDFLVPGPPLAGNAFVKQLTHVTVAQDQELLGSPRPNAPFEFANAWGNNYAILLCWFVLGFLVLANRRTRWWAAPILAVSAIPAIYSQNRGMWLGLGLAVAYMIVRFALLGRYRVVLAAVAGTMLVALSIFVIPPLNNVIVHRIQTPHSNEIRASLARQAVAASLHSPFVGYGTTRKTIGSERSATIGATADCPRCGNRVIGSTGQLSLMLICHGILGAGLYYLFIGQAVVRYWRDRTWLGVVGVLALILMLFFGLFYGALVSPLAVAMLSLGLLWRNAQLRAAADA